MQEQTPFKQTLEDSVAPETGIGELIQPPAITTLPSFPPSAELLRKSDLILLQSAVQAGWQLSDKTKSETVLAAEWIRDHAKNHRDRLRAAEFLLSVDKHNLEIVKAASPQQVQVDITSGGHAIGDTSRLTDDQIAQRLAQLEQGK